MIKNPKIENLSTLGVKRKIMLMVSMVIIFAIITTVGPIMYIQSDRLFVTYQEKTEVAVSGLEEAFAESHRQTTLAAKTAASIPNLVEAIEARNQEDCLRTLSPIIKEEGIDFGTITDEKGNVIVRTHSTNTGDNVANLFTVQQAIRGTTASTVEPTSATLLSVRSSVPVKNSSGRIVGTISLSMDGTKNELVDKIKTIHGVEATIFAGDIRVSTTLSKDGQRAIETIASSDIVETVLKKGADFTGQADVNGTPFVTSYKPIKGPNGDPIGMIVAGKSLESYYEDRNHQLLVVAGLAMVNLAVCLLIAYWMANTLYSPLVQGLNRYKNENKKLNQLIDLCPFGIVLYDESGNVSAINRAFYEYRLPTFKKEDFIGRSGQYLAKSLGVVWEESASYWALKGIETLNGFMNNPHITYLINSVPLRDCENVITGAMTIVHDITEYEKLKEEMAKLDRLNLVGEMAAGVAHEIRNPMTVVKGYLQFLSGKVSSSMAEQFRTALDELERVEQIISDFLSLARNKLTEDKEQDLNTIIKSVIPLIQTEAIKRSTVLEVKLTEETTNLLLNENEIKQLLLNLTRNGMDAMNQQGILTIETGVEDDAVYLCIVDTGNGIPKEHHEKIFDPFFTTKANGTGLGLAVCAGIVRRHNGTIEIQSEEGEGTKFKITFKKVGRFNSHQVLKSKSSL